MIADYYGKFSLINNPEIGLGKNIYMPKGLQEKVFLMKNLFTLHNNMSEIPGGSIGFESEYAKKSAFGELIERYASSFQDSKDLIFGNYNDLSKKQYCFSPDAIQYFGKSQYNSDTFKLKRLQKDTEIYWKKCIDFISGESILLPFFMVNVENIMHDGLYHYNTTTGTAAHITAEKAITGGFLECMERDAFCKFWYLQKTKKYKKYHSDFIVDYFKEDKEIQELYTNKKIKLITFDISELGHVPVFVVFILFEHNHKVFQSVGAAARFDKVEALKKACIEAYQGIEYALMSMEKIQYNEEEIKNNDFSQINNFKKHFTFYNAFPELRKQVPILKALFDSQDYINEWEVEQPYHLTHLSKEELVRVGINQFYYADLTTADIGQLGFKVIKTVVPQLHLLTGNYNYPYLGLFNNNLELFTTYPHPFP